ncbi:MAG: hypothetical protein QW648_03970 [Nanoarchaeales archaeon]
MKKYSFIDRKREKSIEKVIRKLKKLEWRYKNLILLLISIIFGIFLIKSKVIDNFAKEVGNLSYLGIFICGIFYAFSLSVAPSIAIFYSFGKVLNPFIIASIGALGSVIGDYLIFRFVKVNLKEEIKLIWEDINNKFYFKDSIFYRIFPFSNLIFSFRFKLMMNKVYSSKIYNFLIKILAIIIIASPLPDEFGVTLLGLTNQETKSFILISYFCNFFGILSISYLHKI